MKGQYRSNEADVTEYFNVVGEIELNEDERSILNNNPKLAVLERFDEETLLTEASVRGIMNFITADKHSFGQGTTSTAHSTSFHYYLLWATLKPVALTPIQIAITYYGNNLSLLFIMGSS